MVKYIYIIIYNHMYIIYSYVVHLDYSYNHIYKIITWVKHESDILRDDFCHHGEFVVSWPQQDITGLPNHVWWISAWQKLSSEARAIHDARTIGTNQGDEPIQPVKPLESHLVDHWAMKKNTTRFPISWNPPAPKVLGRDLPDGTRKRLQVYLGGGGHFSAKTSCFW